MSGEKEAGLSAAARLDVGFLPHVLGDDPEPTCDAGPWVVRIERAVKATVARAERPELRAFVGKTAPTRAIATFHSSLRGPPFPGSLNF